MRKQSLGLCITVLLFGGFACTQPQYEIQTDVDLNTLIDSASYVVGFQTGNRLASQGFRDISPEKYMAGFVEAVEQGENKIDAGEIRALFARLNDYLMDKTLVENAEEESVFFTENRTKPGVVETDSGLQYKIIREGEGQKPFAQNSVRVMYEGRLIDGSIFDTTYDTGQPSEFVVGQVIAGWIEGLQLMSVGAEFEFYIPNDLAYGENPRPGGVIMPGDALIFKVELLEIIP